MTTHIDPPDKQSIACACLKAVNENEERRKRNNLRRIEH